MNPLIRLNELGQSVWLDLLSRKLIRSGALAKLVQNDAVSGVTSNPAIFEKAMGETSDYDEDIRRLADGGKTATEIFRTLSVQDIQEAAAVLEPVYRATGGLDGFVSLEVSPLLAHDTPGTVQEARELWRAVDRRNVMIKIPATPEGVAAIEECITEGININVTLLFGLSRYQEVVEAYIRGLERRIACDSDVSGIHSVASFFLSRIDVMVDPQLERGAPELQGAAAIASAKLAYRIFRNVFHGDRFRRVRESGGLVQRLLWASTGTKNKQYSDVKYVEPLIGPETVNTMPLETLNAYRDHGKPEVRLQEGVNEAEKAITLLAANGIDMGEIALALENQGIEKFNQPFEKLMQTLDRKRRALAAA